MPREVTCPVCDANIPLEGKDRAGDFVYCSFCTAQLRLYKEFEEEEESGMKAVEEYD